MEYSELSEEERNKIVGKHIQAIYMYLLEKLDALNKLDELDDKKAAEQRSYIKDFFEKYKIDERLKKLQQSAVELKLGIPRVYVSLGGSELFELKEACLKDGFSTSLRTPTPQDSYIGSCYGVDFVRTWER